jgi:hypothetical protein
VGTVFLYFEISGGTDASWNGEGSRLLRLVYACISFNESDQHVLCAVMLTHCSVVIFCARIRGYGIVTSLCSLSFMV